MSTEQSRIETNTKMETKVTPAILAQVGPSERDVVAASVAYSTAMHS